MSQNKKSYFQGTENPTPKKQKYKPEKVAPAQPRFKEPLFKNYDLYETEGVNGPAKHGPGAGFYQHMNEYKSVSDFLKKKRKRNKGKYKASKMERRKALLKIAIDFPIDDQINNPLPFGGTLNGEQFSGILTKYIPEDDFEGKSVDKLDFGRDYTDESPVAKEEGTLPVEEPSLYGLPDGMDPEELDADKTISPRDLDYGTTNSENTLYNKI